MKQETLARIILFFLLAAAGFSGVLVLAPRLGLPALTAPAGAEIHARMPENGGWSAETIYAETGQPIHLRLTSDDVLHSFAIGQSAQLPIDLVPGEWKDTTLTFDQPGRYVFYCTRWCGRDHWRMRGTIIVTGAPKTTAEAASSEKPLYLRLGLDVDAPHNAEVVPAAPPAADKAAAIADQLPAYALDHQTYRESSPALLFQRLRAEPALKDRSDVDLWNAVALAWARQVSPARLEEAKQLYATNCAACHGETGKGDGVMDEGLPRFVPGETHASPTTGGDTPAMPDSADMRLSAPPDFTDPRVLLGASPALLEGKMLRGGMGTGMPYWGPIFTPDQMDALIAYLYTFAMK